MNCGQFKDPFSYLCFVGTVVPSSSLTEEVAGSKTFFLQKMSQNSWNSMKTFRGTQMVQMLPEIHYLPKAQIKA